MTSHSRLGPVLLLAALASAPAIAADAFPTKPVRIVVTFPPGGSTDAVLRMIAPRLSQQLGQQAVIDNRPGAGGNIGMAAVAQADADGHVIGVGAAGALAANASLYKDMPFDAQRDFAPVSLLAHVPFVIVARADDALATLPQILDAAREHPGTLTMAHGGNGTAMHLSVELLRQMGKADITGIAYRGNGPATVDVLGGQVRLAMLDLPSALPHVQAGKLRAVAVTSETRLSALPETPTIAEAGLPGYASTGWFGFVAPAGTPVPVVARWHQAIKAALADPQIARDAETMGVTLAPDTPADFGRFIATETDKWREVIRTAGTRLD